MGIINYDKRTTKALEGICEELRKQNELKKIELKTSAASLTSLAKAFMDEDAVLETGNELSALANEILKKIEKI